VLWCKIEILRETCWNYIRNVTRHVTLHLTKPYSLIIPSNDFTLRHGFCRNAESGEMRWKEWFTEYAKRHRWILISLDYVTKVSFFQTTHESSALRAVSTRLRVSITPHVKAMKYFSRNNSASCDKCFAVSQVCEFRAKIGLQSRTKL